MFIVVLMIVVVGCTSKNMNSDVVKQAKPTIMVIPSDNLLKKHGALTKEIAHGADLYIRDYNAYLMQDKNSKAAISIIQKAFIEAGYPLNDLDNLKVG